MILAEPGINNFQCARSPATLCVFSEYTPDHLAFFTFDPVTGEKQPLTRIEDSEWHLQNWTLSPDGSTLALAKKHLIPSLADIRLFSVASGKDRILTLQSWTGIACLDWAANGRSLLGCRFVANGRADALECGLAWQSQTGPQESEKDLGWAIPSPTAVISPSGKPAAAPTPGSSKASDPSFFAFSLHAAERGEDTIFKISLWGD